MAEKIKGWEDTCERFVAYIDIMGFKNMVLRKSHKEINDMFDSLLPTIETIKKSLKSPFVLRILKSPGKDDIVSTPSAVFPVMFSDSIILISNDDTEISSLFIFAYILMILRVAMEKGIPVKGAIAFGEMTVKPDKSLYFGQPIIDAFELQNELKIYGVVLHDTCEKRLYELKNIEGKGIVKYLVPMKSGRITHYIVDWTSSIDENDPVGLVSQLYNSVSGKRRIYVDNTLEFIQETIKRKKDKKS